MTTSSIAGAARRISLKVVTKIHDKKVSILFVVVAAAVGILVGWGLGSPRLHWAFTDFFYSNSEVVFDEQNRRVTVDGLVCNGETKQTGVIRYDCRDEKGRLVYSF